MQAVSLSAVRKLPLSASPWEVAFVDMPIQVSGVDTEGMVIIVEANGGLVRAAGPVVRGQSWWPVLGLACSQPAAPAVPALPRRVRCDDPMVAGRLEQAFAGLEVRVEVVASVPEAWGAVKELWEHLASPMAPGLTVELPRWRRTLGSLCQLQPWRGVPDSVVFRFSGRPELDGAVALLLGMAGEQEGLVLYRSEADYLRFQAAMRIQDYAEMKSVPSLCLFIEAGATVEPAELALCESAELVFWGQRVPRALAQADGEARRLTEAEERLLLAAVEGVLSLCTSGLPGLSTAARTRRTRTVLGELTTRSSPPERAIADFEHLLAVLEPSPYGVHQDWSVLLKAHKKNAKRLVERCRGVDRLRFEQRADGVFIVRAFVGDTELGVLSARPMPEGLVASLAASGPVMLEFYSGGPKRRSFFEEDRLHGQRVRIEAPGLEFGLPVVDDLGVTEEDFSGAPSTWPKISATLIDFALLVFGDALQTASPEEMLGTLRAASAIWNAVALADQRGDDSLLRQARALMRDDPVTEALIRCKRERFAADPRLIRSVWSEPGDGELIIKAEATSIAPDGER